MKSLLAGFRFLLASPLVGGIALLGGLLTMASAVRVLYPALAIFFVTILFNLLGDSVRDALDPQETMKL